MKGVVAYRSSNFMVNGNTLAINKSIYPNAGPVETYVNIGLAKAKAIAANNVDASGYTSGMVNVQFTDGANASYETNKMRPGTVSDFGFALKEGDPIYSQTLKSIEVDFNGQKESLALSPEQAAKFLKELMEIKASVK
jgi:hypothetical protein